MSSLNIKHADVLDALDLVKEELDKEAKRIYLVSGEALKSGKTEPAKEAIDYSEKLKTFAKKVELLSGEWKKIESTIGSATPEVMKIVNFHKASESKKTGYKRSVEHVGPNTNFEVRFPNGEIVSDPKALWSFAKTIEKIGADKVAQLGITMAGEPLVSRTMSVYKKYPTRIKKIKSGWLVHTHSSTDTKIKTLEYIKQELKLDFIIKKK